MFVSASYLKHKNELVFRDLLELNCDSYSVEDIITRFVNAWNIDPKRAIRTLIDLRYQYGEKRVFQIICFYLKVILGNHDYTNILNEIPKIGSWKDVLQISKLAYKLGYDIEDEVELFSDNIDDPFCAKWAPSENSHFDKELKFAKNLMKRLNLTPKQYRQRLTRGRKQLNLIESSLSQKRNLSEEPPIVSKEASEKYQRRLKNVNYYRPKNRIYDEQAIGEAYERIVKNILYPSGHYSNLYYDPELVAKISAQN